MRKPFRHDELLGKLRALLRGARGGRTERKPLDAAAERRRLELIDRLGVEGPEFGRAFDPFVARVAATFEVPICLVSIVDLTRQHWTAACGLPSEQDLARGSPRADSFCTHAVEALGPLVVQDAADNPVFANTTLVRRVPFRFYAGVPILSLRGDAVGTLCLIDSQPRVFSHLDLRLLGLFAQRVAADVRRRERTVSPDAAEVGVDEYADLLDAELPIFARPAFVELVDIEAARRIERRQSLVVVLIDVAQGRSASVVDRAEAAFATGWLARLTRTRLAMLIAGVEADATSKKAAAVVGEDGSLRAVDVTGRVAHGFQILRDIGAL